VLYSSNFRSTCAISSVAALCISLISCFPGMLLGNYLNDSECVPVAPLFTGITLVSAFQMSCIFIVRSLYFRIFSLSLLIIFLSLETATFYYHTCSFSIQNIMMPGLLLRTFLSVCNGFLINMLTLTSRLVSSILLNAHTSVRCLILPPFPCVC